MPLYEYECPKCKQVIEIIAKYDTIPKCPLCGEEMKKIMSESNFHLKGIGWYQTDYKGKQ